MSSKSTVESLLDRVRELEPLIREHAPKSEESRRLSPELVNAYRRAGFYAMYRPEAWGGAGLDPISFLKVVEALARIDAASGWNVGNAASFDCFLVPLFSEEGAREMSDGSHVTHAGAVNPPGRGIPVDGGYRVTARTPFVSGCHEASCCTLGIHIFDGNEPRSAEGEPIVYLAAVPRDEVRILDTWHTLGMRATGSHDVEVENLFVPERRVTVMAPAEVRASVHKGPLYEMSLWAAAPLIGAVTIGIAFAALEEVLEVARRKTPAYMKVGLRDRDYVHTQIARARGKIGAARAYLHQSVRDAWSTACAGERLDPEQKIEIQLATSHANLTSAEAVDVLHDVAGATAIRNQYPLERHFRDIHTLTQHAFGSTSRLESSGRLMLGLENNWGFFVF